MPGRSYTGNGYRYGFNTQEKNDEITGVPGSHTTALHWEYDTRLGRRWNLDPKPVVELSQYCTFSNNPVWFNDVKGDTVGINMFKKEDSFHKQAKSHLKNAEKVDGIYTVYAHGNPNVIMNSNTGEALTEPKDIVNELGKLDPTGTLLKAINDKVAVKLILYSCNTGTKTYIDKDAGYQLREYDQSVAEKIMEAYPGVEVVAPVGYQNYNTGQGPSYVTKYTPLGERTVLKPDEAYETFSPNRVSGKEKTDSDSSFWQSADHFVKKVLDFFSSGKSPKP